MSDPDAEVWRHTFEPGPDFLLSVRDGTIGRVLRQDTVPAPPRWFWTITCVMPFVGITKTTQTISGFVHTKREAIETLRAAWELERDWRAEMRTLTPYHDAGMPHFVGIVVWEGYERPATVEMAAIGALTHELILPR